ncbi:MAG: type I methionyl aminopeptidase [Candidatus Brocadiia bacterium]
MGTIKLKTPAELARMRQAGRLVAGVLRLMEELAEPGVTTEELDQAAEEYITERGAAPSFKGYRGFPASICASLNEEVVHGIPGPRRLRDGDLLKVDVGVLWEGYHGDATVTVPIGQISQDAGELTAATRRALMAGIQAVRPGGRVEDISRAVQDVAERAGFSVVRDYTGHGIGSSLHEPPLVPNFVAGGPLRSSPVLPEGAVVAIEPMLNAGTYRTKVLENGWTVVTGDGRLSAHFEHTVAVDETGPAVLTLP